ncbi:hypothetical protein PR048_032866 [Dryococelus australis]|uniref:Uncharacterized protein n=1 Tax=Dryococelus australis TaxID=614101 RepID=A0ABQ9G3E9_9NEOP|nr:hypothetical protein PR048_032866 [Dryococelus australis]
MGHPWELLCGRPCDHSVQMSTGSPRDCISSHAALQMNVKNFGCTHPLYQCVTVLRLLHLRSTNPTIWHKLSALESHCQQRQQTQRYEDDRVAVAQFARTFFKLSEFSEEEILRACGIIQARARGLKEEALCEAGAQVNGHEVPVTEPAHIAVYDTASLLEHHCRPNCSKSFTNDGALIIWAAVPIPQGTHLSICYSDALWGTASRRHHLAETKFFWCTCERCADPTECNTFFSTQHCLEESCEGFLLPEEPLKEGRAVKEASWWHCTACPARVSADRVHATAESVGQQLAAMRKGDPASCERFVRECITLLHPNHYYLTDVRLALAQLYGQDHADGLRGTPEDELRKKARLCHDVLSLVDQLAPGQPLPLPSHSLSSKHFVSQYQVHCIIGTV